MVSETKLDFPFLNMPLHLDMIGILTGSILAFVKAFWQK